MEDVEFFLFLMDVRVEGGISIGGVDYCGLVGQFDVSGHERQMPLFGFAVVLYRISRFFFNCFDGLCPHFIVLRRWLLALVLINQFPILLKVPFHFIISLILPLCSLQLSTCFLFLIQILPYLQMPFLQTLHVIFFLNPSVS